MITFTTSPHPRRSFDRREFRQTFIDLSDSAQAAPIADGGPASHVPVLANVALFYLVEMFPERGDTTKLGADPVYSNVRGFHVVPEVMNHAG